MATYVTQRDLARYLSQEGVEPTWDINSSPSTNGYEVVGTGNGTTSKFYLNQKNIIASSYTVYYGTSLGTLPIQLTETTHYTLNKDRGVITLTSTGISSVGTSSVLGTYSYNIAGITSTQSSEALARATSWIDRMTDTHFADGTAQTPDYGNISNEVQDGRGYFDRNYYTEKYPVPIVTTSVSYALTTTATTVAVETNGTNGFPASGNIVVENEEISYTGKDTALYQFTGCTRGANGTTASTHSAGTKITRHKVEISTNVEGTSQSWQTLQLNSEYDLDETGRLHLYLKEYPTSTDSTFILPPKAVPARVRVTYPYCWFDVGTKFNETFIPQDIKRATLMIAAKELMHSTVVRHTIEGRNEFKPELINVDEDWINKTIQFFNSVRVSRT